MCGIVGLVDFRCVSEQETLARMTDALAHRGPDGRGVYFDDSKDVHLGLGHRRLAIIDLTDCARQPMSFEHLRIVCNGELYNYQEIRVLLEDCGYDFFSNSDTEVILKAWHKWGDKALERFVGMFAIAIYDSLEERVFLIRDRAGVKPLFWYWNNGLFMFASELKSFHLNPGFVKEIDHSALALYFQYGYISEPYTVFVNTHKLSAGSYLVFDIKSRNIIKNKYWDLIDYYEKPVLEISESEAEEELERILIEAANYRMVADVPVGMFLSGGYDSSLVTALIQKHRTERLKTFSIGFREDGYDEAPFAKKVAEFLGTDHMEHYCTKEDAAEIIPLLPTIYDEPFGDSSAIPTILVSRFARKEVTVSLSADGGDEVFAGYDKYPAILQKRKLMSLIPDLALPTSVALLSSSKLQSLLTMAGIQNAPDRMNRFAFALSQGDKGLVSAAGSLFIPPEIGLLMKPCFERYETNYDRNIDADPLSRILALEYKSYLVDDLLVKVDRATMSAGLEGREPLLDHRIAEFAARLPSRMKLKNGSKKHILKSVIYKYIPAQLIDRPKRGFMIPISSWLRNELKDNLMHYLGEEKIKETSVLDYKVVAKLRDQFLVNDTADVNKIWFLLMYSMWHEKWI